ncbi:hypothetical protein SBRY_40435 [Actinacidiphila bryophytorum]|uniref:Uncharacterized protein n=1 Tax=Actinacidiphila bryophytorum TaxID=1436133 RepID=A0A9W4H2W6_9ACTN|nr:hypothetical protein SBRY_40435 [Actinacidiphila bryophytorum]
MLGRRPGRGFRRGRHRHAQGRGLRHVRLQRRGSRTLPYVHEAAPGHHHRRGQQLQRAELLERDADAPGGGFRGGRHPGLRRDPDGPGDHRAGGQVRRPRARPRGLAGGLGAGQVGSGQDQERRGARPRHRPRPRGGLLQHQAVRRRRPADGAGRGRQAVGGQLGHLRQCRRHPLPGPRAGGHALPGQRRGPVQQRRRQRRRAVLRRARPPGLRHQPVGARRLGPGGAGGRRRRDGRHRPVLHPVGVRLREQLLRDDHLPGLADGQHRQRRRAAEQRGVEHRHRAAALELGRLLPDRPQAGQAHRPGGGAGAMAHRGTAGGRGLRRGQRRQLPVQRAGVPRPAGLPRPELLPVRRPDRPDLLRRGHPDPDRADRPVRRRDPQRHGQRGAADGTGAQEPRRGVEGHHEPDQDRHHPLTKDADRGQVHRSAAQPPVPAGRHGGPLRPHRPVLPAVRRLRALPAALHRLGVAAHGQHARPEPHDLAGRRQLHRAVERPRLLAVAAQHLHHRTALRRAAVAGRPGAGETARPAPARGDLLPRRAARPLRHVGRRGSADLPVRLPAEQRRVRQLGAAPVRHRTRRLGTRDLDLEVRGGDHRVLALDRIQHADLPGRHAGRPHRAVRGGNARRRQQAAAVPQGDRPGAAADDPVHRHHLRDRLAPAVRGALPLRRQRPGHQRGPRQPVLDAGALRLPARVQLGTPGPGGGRRLGHLLHRRGRRGRQRPDRRPAPPIGLRTGRTADRDTIPPASRRRPAARGTAHLPGPGGRVRRVALPAVLRRDGRLQHPGADRQDPAAAGAGRPPAAEPAGRLALQRPRRPHPGAPDGQLLHRRQRGHRLHGVLLHAGRIRLRQAAVRRTQRPAGARRRHHRDAAAAQRPAAVPAHRGAALDGPAAGGDPAGPGHRLRGVLHAAVPGPVAADGTARSRAGGRREHAAAGVARGLPRRTPRHGGAGDAHLRRGLERLPVAADRAHPVRQPHPPGRPGRHRRRLQRRRVGDHGRRGRHHRAAAGRLRGLRQADRRRRHAGRGQGLTGGTTTGHRLTDGRTMP